jgi:hypothetical protein
MTTQATSDLTAVLIERVRKVAAVGVEKKTVTWSRMEKTEVEPAGTSVKPYRIPFVPTDNSSEQWASSEGFDYAPGNRQEYDEMTVSYVRMSGTISVSKDVMQINEQNASAIFNTILNETKNKTIQLKKRFNQYAKGSGTGVIGTVSAVASPTVTFGTDVFGVWKLRYKNLRVQFYDSTLATQRVGGGVTVSTVSSYNIASKTVTFDAIPSDAVATDLVVVVGAANNVFRGTRYHLNNSGTYQNKSRSTNPQLNALVMSNGSAALSLSFLSALYHTSVFRVEEATSDGMFNKDGFVWSFPPGQCHAYELIGQVRGQIMQNGTAGKLDLGFTGMSHNNIPILSEVDQQDDEIELINFSKLVRFQLKALSPEMYPGGGIYWPQNAASGQGHADALNIYLTYKGEIGSWNPKEIGARGSSVAVSSAVSRHLA